MCVRTIKLNKREEKTLYYELTGYLIKLSQTVKRVLYFFLKKLSRTVTRYGMIVSTDIVIRRREVRYGSADRASINVSIMISH